MTTAVSMASVFIFAAVSAMMSFSMVTALDVGIIRKFSIHKRFYRLIGISGHSAVQLDSRLGKSILRPHTDSAADQGIHAQPGQKTCKRPVAASVRICHLFFCDLPVFHIIDLKLLCVSEMLKYISILKCYCYSHCIFPFH